MSINCKTIICCNNVRGTLTLLPALQWLRRGYLSMPIYSRMCIRRCAPFTRVIVQKIQFVVNTKSGLYPAIGVMARQERWYCQTKGRIYLSCKTVVRNFLIKYSSYLTMLNTYSLRMSYRLSQHRDFCINEEQMKANFGLESYNLITFDVNLCHQVSNQK